MTGASILLGLKAQHHRDIERKEGEELTKHLDRMERERHFLLTLELLNYRDCSKETK